jgi:hypothetical protein
VSNSRGSTLIQDSIIANNTAGYQGGGINQHFGTLTIIRSLISRNRQTSSINADRGGGGVYIYYNAVLNVRETTIEHNRATSNSGHQILAYKWNYHGGAPAVTVVNTRFIPCTACETTGTNLYLYDRDAFSGGAAAYGTFSRKTCSASPCTVSPFTGACANRTDDANHGVLCERTRNTCGAGYSHAGNVTETSLPPSNQTCTACPSGQYQPQNQYTGLSCNSCVAGKYLSNDECLVCPA